VAVLPLVSKLTTKPPSGAGVSRVIVNVPLVGPVSVGVVPTAMLTLGVVLMRMEVVLLKEFAVATSGFPSPLKSPMLTDLGLVPVGKSTVGAKVGVVAPVGVVLRRMEVVSLPWFAVATSGEPSPLKSPMLTENGLAPVGKSTLGAKVGMRVPMVVVLRRMEVVLLIRFATATSGEPSPLKSPMLAEKESVPVVKSTLGAKVGVVAPVGVVLRKMEVLLL